MCVQNCTGKFPEHHQFFNVTVFRKPFWGLGAIYYEIKHQYLTPQNKSNKGYRNGSLKLIICLPPNLYMPSHIT